MPQFDNVSVTKQANVYFDGKCVSHTLVLADGTRKSLGVIFPSRLNFTTAAPEVIDVQLQTGMAFGDPRQCRHVPARGQ